MTDAVHPQERTARELLTQSPGLFVGTSDGLAVYYDSYERAFAIVNADGDGEKLKLSETEFSTPGEFCDDIDNWDVGPRIGGSLADDIARVAEAAQ